MVTTDTALPIAVDFIAEHEGFRSAPYLDSAGTASIGYGFTYLVDGSKVTMHTPHMSQPVAKARLASMVAGVMKNVRLLVTVPITDHAAAALCSFCYNLGTNALKTSTLLRLLNDGNAAGAAGQFAGWCFAGGHKDDGLVNRRGLERELFLTPDAAPVGDNSPATQTVSVPVVSDRSTLPVHPAPRVEDEADLLMDQELNALNNGGAA